MSVGGGCGTATMWFRFKKEEICVNDYYYMSSTSWDATEFIALESLTFHGFGVIRNYEKKDNLKYMIKYCIGEDNMSDEIEIEKNMDDCDDDKLHFSVTLKDLGAKPIKVTADTSIHCCVRVTSDDYEVRRHGYGSGGYPEKIA